MQIPVHLTIGKPFPTIVIIKSVPLDLGGDPLEPSGGAIVTYMQPILPFYRPFKRPLSYPKYKKTMIWIFMYSKPLSKVTMKL